MNFRKILFCLLAFAGLATVASAQTVIKAGTAIKIEIRGVPAEEAQRVAGDYPVSDGGTVNMPYLGPIGAAGLSPSALGSRIESAYKSAQIYKTPTILVIASTGDTLQKQVIHVGGRARRPGQVEYVQGLTIYQAIQAAGGADEFGAMNRVLLTRLGKVRTLDVTQSQFKNYVLQQSDTIEIPEKNVWGR